MKIGLVNPPCEYTSDPLHRDFFYLGGIINIEAALDRAGYNAQPVDFSHDKNASLDSLADCDVVGLTSFVSSYGFFKRRLPELKRQGKTIVVGGALISSYGLALDNVLMREFPEIDFGVIGEGEITAVNLIRSLEGKGELPGGLVYRDKGELKVSGPAEIACNLDELPEIDYSKWHAFVQAVNGHSLNLHQMARGCYNRCTFCFRISEQAGIRSFSLPRIERELEKATALHPRDIHFSDDTFTYDKARASAVVHLAKKFGLRYVVLTRVNDVDFDLMKTFRDTGCDHVKLGVESFDENVRKKTGKNISNEQIYRAIEICRQAGVKAVGFFMIGLPGESRESIETTIQGIKETGILPRARLLIPLPGTEIYRQVVQEGKIDEAGLLRNFSESMHGDTTYGNWVPINLSDGLSGDELLEARNRIHALREEMDKKMR